MKKKFLAFVMVMAMALTMIPGVALADGAVAKVGNVEYTDIQEAIKAAAPAGTVELLSDVTVEKWIMFSETLSISSGQIITLDINGLTINGNRHTLTIKSVESAGNGNRLFYDATNLNINDLTIILPVGTSGIGLKSGTISNVTINGGKWAIFPGNGNITITGCTFNDTTGTAIYYEEDRDNLVVDGNTFNTAEGGYAIQARGETDFTNNTITKGKVTLAGSASGEISGNDFGDQRLKVYTASTATISNNKINTLAFEDNATEINATFADNTLSEAAEDALAGVGATNTVTPPTTSPKPASTGSGISVKYNGGNSFSTSNSAVPTGVEIDGVAVPFSGTGSNFTVGCVDPGAKWVTVRWNSTSVTTNFTPDALVECSVSIPKTGDMPVWAAVLALFGF